MIAASANVVCAGLAEQYGYPITFNTFFRYEVCTFRTYTVERFGDKE